MIKRLSRYKRGTTIVLGLAGIGIMTAYSLCSESCMYLRGTMLGLDLKYLGMLYMGSVLAASGLGKNAACAAGVSTAAANSASPRKPPAAHVFRFADFCMAVPLVAFTCVSIP